MDTPIIPVTREGNMDLAERRAQGRAVDWATKKSALELPRQPFPHSTPYGDSKPLRVENATSKRAVPKEPGAVEIILSGKEIGKPSVTTNEAGGGEPLLRVCLQPAYASASSQRPCSGRVFSS